MIARRLVGILATVGLAIGVITVVARDGDDDQRPVAQEEASSPAPAAPSGTPAGAVVVTTPGSAKQGPRAAEPGRSASTMPVDTGASATLDGCDLADATATACGLRVVGSHAIGGRNDNFNMAVIGDCAYVSSMSQTAIALKTPFPKPSDGVAVLDVSEPNQPRLVTTLRSPGATDSGETLHAVDTGDRKVLVVGAYGGRATNTPLDEAIGPALDVYDVSTDCTQPTLRSTVYWPDNAHNVTLNPAGTRVYGTRFAPNPGPTAAMVVADLLGLGGVVAASPVPLTNVMVMDISDLAKPHLAADLTLDLPDGSTGMCHNVHFDETETRMYCAGRVPFATAPDGREPIYSVWPFAGPTIWDVSDFPRGVPNPKARFVGASAVKGQGAHHAVPFAVSGRRYVVAGNELAFTCDMAAYPRVWDIIDETHPVVVSELHVPPAESCAGNHYNNVVDYGGTPLAVVGWTTAGFRVFDLSDPIRPREVANFRPGGTCTSYGYLHEATDQLWFACDIGFFVVELNEQVQQQLGTPGPAQDVVRPPSSVTAAAARPDWPTAIYCNLV